MEYFYPFVCSYSYVHRYNRHSGPIYNYKNDNELNDNNAEHPNQTSQPRLPWPWNLLLKFIYIRKKYPTNNEIIIIVIINRRRVKSNGSQSNNQQHPEYSIQTPEPEPEQ